MSHAPVCLDTEVRKLRPAELYTLGQILNASDSWKKLMAIVPRERTPHLPKFSTEHFSMVEQAVQQQKRNAAEIFLDEWGTMGRNRPTLRILLDLLVKAELFRAADYVAGDILKGELPKRPECGPAAAVDISDEAIGKLLQKKAELCDNNFDESVILGSTTELNTNKIVYLPDAMVEAVNQCSLERNMQSTKLISEGENENKKNSENLGSSARKKYMDVLPNADISDLMKFSTDHRYIEQGDRQHTDHCKHDCHGNATHGQCNDHDSSFSKELIYEKQEISSQELPAFLNEFGQSKEHTKTNQEIKSDQLPACLNSSIRMSSNSMSHNNVSWHSSDVSQRCDLYVSQNEMVSFDLPQCVIELGANSMFQNNANNIDRNVSKQNSTPNVLNSQELPTVVLEYNG